MPEPVTEEIIQKAVAGDERAFRTIVEQLQRLGYSVAFRFAGQEDEAEDILQEAFVKLWKNLGSYRKEVKLSTWFYRIVTNQSLDYLKSRQGKQRKQTADLNAAKNTRSQDTPEEEYQVDELMQIVRRCAHELTPKQQAVFVLRDLEGLPVEEVMTILEMTAGNIKSNLFHARQAIGEKLKKQYNEIPRIS